MQEIPTPSVLGNVGGNLRRFRREAGLSQTALAERSGISRRTIINLEAGEANISLSGLDRLAEALGTSFAMIVAAPTAPASAINEVAWRGRQTESVGTLLGSAPASHEAQLWTWSLGPGDRYDAEPDPAGWHEMILVLEGRLRIQFADSAVRLDPGNHATYSSAQPYAYVNDGDVTVKFARTVVS
jgi:transcriptional regulator with XRE-family HTH domain